MGKAIPSIIKRRAEELSELLGDKISSSFEENKKLIKSLDLGLSKTDTNLIAGYLTRLASKNKK